MEFKIRENFCVRMANRNRMVTVSLPGPDLCSCTPGRHMALYFLRRVPGWTENDTRNVALYCTPQYYSKKFISAQKFWMMIFNIEPDPRFNFGVFEGI